LKAHRPRLFQISGEGASSTALSNAARAFAG
jgi:hypothetical protein